MNSKKKEISITEGSVIAALLKFAGPILIALVLQAAYGAVDLLIVGKFDDKTGLSAVGTGSSFMHMVTVVVAALSMGATVIIGRYVGEKNPHEAGETVGTSIKLFSGVALALTVLIEIFADKVAVLLSVPDESVDKMISYVRICAAGMIFIVAYNIISGILRGIGNANLPLIFVAIACVSNIILDLVFVGAFKMGASGAALATVMAQAISVIASIFALKKCKLPIVFSKKNIHINKTILNKIINVGIPIAAQELLVQISFLVINRIINEMGVEQSAGYGVAQKIVSFIMLIPSAIMQSLSAFVSQNVGAEKPERAKKAYYCSMIIGCSIGVVICLIGIFGGEFLASGFSNEADVQYQASLYLKGFAWDCILTCILFSGIGYFNGYGRSIPVMIQGITSAFCIRIPVSILMSKLPDTSLMLVGLATPITTVYGIIFFAICFKKYTNKETHFLETI